MAHGLTPAAAAGAVALAAGVADGELRTVVMHLLGDRIDPALSRNGVDQPKDLIAIFHAGKEPVSITIPGTPQTAWSVQVDTAGDLPDTVMSGAKITMTAHSVAALSPLDPPR